MSSVIAVVQMHDNKVFLAFDPPKEFDSKELLERPATPDELNNRLDADLINGLSSQYGICTATEVVGRGVILRLYSGYDWKNVRDDITRVITTYEHGGHVHFRYAGLTQPETV